MLLGPPEAPHGPLRVPGLHWRPLSCWAWDIPLGVFETGHRSFMTSFCSMRTLTQTFLVKMCLQNHWASLTSRPADLICIHLVTSFAFFNIPESLISDASYYHHLAFPCAPNTGSQLSEKSIPCLCRQKLDNRGAFFRSIKRHYYSKCMHVCKSRLWNSTLVVCWWFILTRELHKSILCRTEISYTALNETLTEGREERWQRCFHLSTAVAAYSLCPLI